MKNEKNDLPKVKKEENQLKNLKQCRRVLMPTAMTTSRLLWEGQGKYLGRLSTGAGKGMGVGAGAAVAEGAGGGVGAGVGV